MWFTVRCYFKSSINQSNDSHPLYEESIFLFRADSEEEAEKLFWKSEQSKKSEYKNSAGERVVWELVKILGVEFIAHDTELNGAEVYGFTTRKLEDITDR